METLFANAKLSRRAMLVPLEVIERIRSMVSDENSDVKNGTRQLDKSLSKLHQRMDKDHRDPKSNFRRVATRVVAALGSIGYLTLTSPAAPAVFAGLLFSATWLYVHQHYFRKWRELDNERLLKAIERRDKKHLRVPFEKKSVRQRVGRVATWGVLLTFSPFGFAFETVARVQRNARLRVMKRRFERQRDVVENTIKSSMTRIEGLAKQEAKGPVQQLPEHVEPGREAHDKHHWNASTPPAAPAPIPAGSATNFDPDDDHLSGHGGFSGGSLA
jgi:hypothetical protein